MAAPDPLPRLCFLGHRHLREFAMPVIAQYRTRAQVELVDGRPADVVALARARVDDGRVDAFVSAGANAGLLRQHVRAPVATIQLAGLDILQALIAARRQSRRVGVVVYGQTLPDLEAVKGLLRIEVAQRAYLGMEDARQAVLDLQQQGIHVIVGSSVVVEQAQRQGLVGLLAYSHASIRNGFEDALELARVARLEAERTAQLNAVLHTLQDAVLAVDSAHRVIACNPPMQRLLDAPPGGVLGQRLDRLQPRLSLADTLAGAAAGRGGAGTAAGPVGQADADATDRPQVLRLGRRHWVAKRLPIQVDGAVVGATLTLYDARTIHEADTHLRMQQGRQQAAARHQFSDIQGDSPALQRALDSARRFARTDLTVLVAGETGTGKELFAQAMHNAGRRAGRPFVAVNCAAFPEALLESELFGYEDGAFTGARKGGKRGLLEAAHTGTLFLDEVGDMPLSLQTRLLRVLQEREVLRIGSTVPVPVDLRVVAATHQPLAELVARGRFRQDLYYRLNTLRLQLPPLRARGDDPLAMLTQRLGQCLARLGSPLSAPAVLRPLLPRLRAHPWPGNVRELDNLSERLAAYLLQFDHARDVRWQGLEEECPELYADAAAQPRWLVAGGLADGQPSGHTGDHPSDRRAHAAWTPASPEAGSGIDMGTGPAAQRQARARAALAAHHGNRQATAATLGISRATLWRWLGGAAGTQSREV